VPKKRGKSGLEGVLEPVENVKNVPKKRRASAVDAGGNCVYIYICIYIYIYIYIYIWMYM
jgi:hypothetical protein